MRKLQKLVRRATWASLLMGFAAIGYGADANAGAALVESQGCLQCHTVRRQGDAHETLDPNAPDLAGRLANRYTSPALASALWNHTPKMWADLATRNIAPPNATESNWRDVFAYLYSLEIFNPGADSRNGRQALIDKGCSGCHQVMGAPAPKAADASVPVDRFHADNPSQFIFDLWQHAPQMAKRFAAEGKPWAALNGQNLKDILGYAQNVQNDVPNRKFNLPEPATGKADFEAKCGGCHQGAQSLTNRLGNLTLMDLGASIWNHAPRMPNVPIVSAEEMSRILTYVWDLQYSGQPGDRAMGREAFERARCTACHADATGAHTHPHPGKVFTPFSMVALAWGPGRQVHAAMQAKGVPWPRLSPQDMSNLVAYMNSLPSTGPTVKRP